MSVYVDNAKNKFGRMIMCHMIADTLDELHAMAVDIGMKRGWFQDSRHPHYDLSQAVRKKAITNGAVDLETSLFRMKLKQIRVDRQVSIHDACHCKDCAQGLISAEMVHEGS